MNGANEPRWLTEVAHIPSNFAMMMAKVRSMLSWRSEPGGMRLVRDAIGGGFSTFSPQPEKPSDVRTVRFPTSNTRTVTDDDIHLVTYNGSVHQYTRYLGLRILLSNDIDIIWPLDLDSVAVRTQHSLILASLHHCECEDVLDESQIRRWIIGS